MARIDIPSITTFESSPSLHFASNGVLICAFSVSSTFDSDATDHTTGATNLFCSYAPFSGKDKV